MCSYSGSCEIIVAKDELELRDLGRKQKPPLGRKGPNKFLEDDINHLFKSISLTSSKSLDLLDHVRRDASKRPTRGGGSHSPGIGFSDPVSLKQALRGLCISQAADMATMKRLSKPPGTPSITEAGRITSSFRFADTSESGFPHSERLVQDERTSEIFNKAPHYRQELYVKSANHSPHSSPRLRTLQSNGDPKLQSPGQSPFCSPKFVSKQTIKSAESITKQNERIFPEENVPNSGKKVSQQLTQAKVRSPNQNTLRSPRLIDKPVIMSAESTVRQKERMMPAESTSSTAQKMPRYPEEPKMKLPCQRSSPRLVEALTIQGFNSPRQKKENASMLNHHEIKSPQTVSIEEEVLTSAASSSSFTSGNDVLGSGPKKLQHNANRGVVTSFRIANKKAPKLRRKAMLQNISSSIATRSNKETVKNKTIVKKKAKSQATLTSGTFNLTYEASGLMESPKQLICQQCQRALKNVGNKSVVYRDLKPENILVWEDGHIMLTDFDLSLRCSVNPTLLKSSSLGVEAHRISGPCAGSNCIDPVCSGPSKLKAEAAAFNRSLPQLVVEPTEARSNSFVGTHEYLVPEIIKGEGHGSAVDWWTLGVFLYELLYGKTPFKGAGNEETLANVVMQNLRFPDSPLVSFQARDLIRGLLVKEPQNRLGTGTGAAEIKRHPFFDGLNWALIRCAIPPEVPDLCDIGYEKLAYQEKSKMFFEYGSKEHLEFELF
ncbi:unnamed protein product [Withania somnifera]